MDEDVRQCFIGMIFVFTLGALHIFDRLDEVYMEGLTRDKELSSLKQRNEDLEVKVEISKIELSSLKTAMEKLTEVETLKVELSSLKTTTEELTEEIKRMKNTPPGPINVFLKSCLDILNNHPGAKGKDGVYQIYVNYQLKSVYCDMSTDGGGWTVIQRRKDGSTDFYRTWDDYKHGFGDPSEEYWIGNDAIHDLTKTTQQELRIDLQTSDDKFYCLYSRFEVGNEISKYKLTVEGYSGTTCDSLKDYNGMKFSTYDQDNDEDDKFNIAELWKGAWWFRKFPYTNLNGKYAGKIRWRYWSFSESLKGTKMMIRFKG
ncbi:fibrinogen-like protein A isoform X2 [Ostrea edulis]|uniref:fibrinogen-like protein A isoform X2 n=1 Tax=Ostrea edulis TaxID=37623 RepID=UPI0024AF126F|nr:fibrinogen-like protein A isoform X2 [Ostrea edulis]